MSHNYHIYKKIDSYSISINLSWDYFLFNLEEWTIYINKKFPNTQCHRTYHSYKTHYDASAFYRPRQHHKSQQSIRCHKYCTRNSIRKKARQCEIPRFDITLWNKYSGFCLMYCIEFFYSSFEVVLDTILI